LGNKKSCAVALEGGRPGKSFFKFKLILVVFSIFGGGGDSTNFPHVLFWVPSAVIILSEGPSPKELDSGGGTFDNRKKKGLGSFVG